MDRVDGTENVDGKFGDGGFRGGSANPARDTDIHSRTQT